MISALGIGGGGRTLHIVDSRGGVSKRFLDPCCMLGYHLAGARRQNLRAYTKSNAMFVKREGLGKVVLLPMMPRPCCHAVAVKPRGLLLIAKGQLRYLYRGSHRVHILFGGGLSVGIRSYIVRRDVSASENGTVIDMEIDETVGPAPHEFPVLLRLPNTLALLLSKPICPFPSLCKALRGVSPPQQP